MSVNCDHGLVFAYMSFKLITDDDTHTWTEASIPGLYHDKIYLCSKCKSYKMYQHGVIWSVMVGTTTAIIGGTRKRNIDFGVSIVERHVTTSCDDELINQILGE